jgi:hypothetical protein
MIRKTVRGQDARTTRVSDQGCFYISNKNTIVLCSWRVHMINLKINDVPTYDGVNHPADRK